MDLWTTSIFVFLTVMVHPGVFLMATDVADVTGSLDISSAVENQTEFLTSSTSPATSEALTSLQFVNFHSPASSLIFTSPIELDSPVTATDSARVIGPSVSSPALPPSAILANELEFVSSTVQGLSSTFVFSTMDGNSSWMSGEPEPPFQSHSSVKSVSSSNVNRDRTRPDSVSSNASAVASTSAFSSFLELLMDSGKSNRSRESLPIPVEQQGEGLRNYSFDGFADDLASFIVENERRGTPTVQRHPEPVDVPDTALVDTVIATKPSISVSTAISTSTSTRVFARSSNRKQRQKQTGYQDIISGLVKLLGGKNVHVANSRPSSGSDSTDKAAVAPSRINHRAPPKLTFAEPFPQRLPPNSHSKVRVRPTTSEPLPATELVPSQVLSSGASLSSTDHPRVTDPSVDVVHTAVSPSEPTLVSDSETAKTVASRTEELPSGPITEWLPARGSHPVGYHPTLLNSDVASGQSSTSANSATHLSSVPTRTTSDSRHIPSESSSPAAVQPATEVSYATIAPTRTTTGVDSKSEPSSTARLESSTRKSSKTPDASDVTATPPLSAHPGTSKDSRQPLSAGTVLPVPSRTLAPSGATPPPHRGTHAFGTLSNEEPTGSPFVIPVDIQHIRLGNENPAPGPIFGGPYRASSTQSVYIDGRKTYFNLMPTEAHGGSDSTLVNVGIGYSFPTDERPPLISQGSVSNVKLPNPPRPGVGHQQPPRSSPTNSNNNKTPIRIDTCIIGDERACNVQLNETCRVESGVSSCNCRLGYGRDGLEQGCKPVVSLVVYIKVDRVHNEVISFGPEYENPVDEKYQILEYEAKNAVDSVFSLSALAESYTGCIINAFFPVGGRVIINTTVSLLESPQTRSPTIKQEIRRGLISVIRQQNQNIGQSSLYVDGPLNPIPGVQDLDECADSNLNDCSKNAVCTNSFGAFKCACLEGFLDKYLDDSRRGGRICSVCSPQYCNNRGECVITNGQKECRCQGNYIGAQCETDGEVLGVALGASLAALVIIGLTFVCLCMWSRRWKQVQQKMIGRPSSGGFGNNYNHFNKSNPQPDFHLPLEDRIRWSHTSEQTDNFYAPDPIIPGSNPKNYTTARPPLPTAPPPSNNIHKLVQPLRSLPAPLTGSRSNILDDTDEDDHGNFDTATNPNTRFHFPRPKSRAVQNGHNNIYYDVSFPNGRDHYNYDKDYGTINAFQMKSMRPLHS